jgi:hypothetical protein
LLFKNRIQIKFSYLILIFLSVNDADFSEKISKNIDKIIVKYENYIVFGDINFDILNENKYQPLNDICDIFDLDQLVKEPTCFKKDCVPSLVDVVLTNKKSSCFNTLNLPTGVNDCHNLISTTIKGHLPAQQRSKIIYRSQARSCLYAKNQLLAHHFGQKK